MALAHVQGGAASGTGSADAAFTLGSNSAIGNLIVVGVSSYNGAIGTVNDAGRNTWTKVLQSLVSTIDVEIWYCVNVYNSTPLTVTAQVSNFASITVDEFSGQAASPLDHSASQSATSSAPSSGNVIVTATDLVYGVLATEGVEGGFTHGTGYTSAGSEAYSSGVNLGIAAEYLLNTAATPADPSFTLGNSVPWNMAAVTFKGAVSVGGLFLPATLSLGSGGPFFQTAVNG
jgi:hypothetical protein